MRSLAGVPSHYSVNTKSLQVIPPPHKSDIQKKELAAARADYECSHRRGVEMIEEFRKNRRREEALANKSQPAEGDMQRKATVEQTASALNEQCVREDEPVDNDNVANKGKGVEGHNPAEKQKGTKEHKSGEKRKGGEKKKKTKGGEKKKTTENKRGGEKEGENGEEPVVVVSKAVGEQSPVAGSRPEAFKSPCPEPQIDVPAAAIVEKPRRKHRRTRG